MKQTIKIELADTSTEVLTKVVSDLETYPEWLDLVDKVEPETDTEAWLVTLTAKIGPIKRSKKLRMVRKPAEKSTIFERQETHDRDFSSWVMQATVQPGESENSAALTVDLSYDGSYWSSALEAILEAKTPKVKKKLEAYLDQLDD